jgi:uncharacterized membrane protein YfcA
VQDFPDQPILFIAIAFLFAGFVKGTLGIGLPTVVMGLLSIVMPPAQAAALMVLPAIATNLWQMLAGPTFWALVRRYATMIVAVVVGTFLTIGFMTRAAGGAQAALGLVLVAYGAYGLFARRFQVKRERERWVSPVVGLATGLLLGATGIFVVPVAPYLTSLQLDKEELLQSIGIMAFVCPLTLGVALAIQGSYPAGFAGGSVLALIPALAGMWAGQRLRRRLDAATFMRWFFAGMIALGGYMFLRAVGN